MKNKWVLFMSRVAFICNLCFLLGMVIKFTKDFIPDKNIEGTIVLLGIFVSIILNVILQFCLFILRVMKKEIPVSAWLRITNVAVFAIQIIYHFLTSGN